jgi:hypothetical protein
MQSSRLILATTMAPNKDIYFEFFDYSLPGTTPSHYKLMGKDSIFVFKSLNTFNGMLASYGDFAFRFFDLSEIYNLWNESVGSFDMINNISIQYEDDKWAVAINDGNMHLLERTDVLCNRRTHTTFLGPCLPCNTPESHAANLYPCESGGINSTSFFTTTFTNMGTSTINDSN